MTKYNEELAMLETTNTKAGLEFQLCGVFVEQEIGLISQAEAKELATRISEKLARIAE